MATTPILRLVTLGALCTLFTASRAQLADTNTSNYTTTSTTTTTPEPNNRIYTQDGMIVIKTKDMVVDIDENTTVSMREVYEDMIRDEIEDTEHEMRVSKLEEKISNRFKELESVIALNDRTINARIDQKEQELAETFEQISGEFTGQILRSTGELENAISQAISGVHGRIDGVDRRINGLEQTQGTHAGAISSLTSDLGDIERDSSNLKSGINSLTTKIGKVGKCGKQGLVSDAVNSACITPFTGCKPITVANQKSFMSGNLNNGDTWARSKLKCKDGYFPTGPSTMRCEFGQLKNKPSCGKCANDCKTCTGSSKSSCTACYPGKRCMNVFSCRQAYNLRMISYGRDTDITLEIRNQPSRTITASCFWDGSRVYTNFKCTALNRGSSCTNNNKASNGNTCKDYGYQMTPYRSKNHMSKITSKWGRSSTWFKVVNVYRTSGGCGSCTSHAMNSGSHARHSWRTFDGGSWWLRDSRYSEPNGDYSSYCWLLQYDWSPGNVRFNDAHCHYWTNRYICIDKDH